MEIVPCDGMEQTCLFVDLFGALLADGCLVVCERLPN
jgi:hypothetical protein